MGKQFNNFDRFSHHIHLNDQGVYEFLNKITGRQYIGSTSDLNNRIKWHWTSLKHGRHDNAPLQQDFDKYGCEHFAFNVLEYVNESWLLTDCEQKWIDKYGLENLYNLRNATTKPYETFKRSLEKPIDESLIKTLSARNQRWNKDKDNNQRIFFEKHGPEDIWDNFIRVVQMDLHSKIIAIHDTINSKKIHTACRQYGVKHKNRFKPYRVDKSFWAYEKFILPCNICKCKPEISSDMFLCPSCGCMELHITNSLHNIERYKLTFFDSDGIIKT